MKSGRVTNLPARESRFVWFMRLFGSAFEVVNVASDHLVPTR